MAHCQAIAPSSASPCVDAILDAMLCHSRDFIAFPTAEANVWGVQEGFCPMAGSPSVINSHQFKSYEIKQNKRLAVDVGFIYASHSKSCFGIKKARNLWVTFIARGGYRCLHDFNDSAILWHSL